MKPIDIVKAQDITMCKHCKPDKMEVSNDYHCMLEEGFNLTSALGNDEYCTIDDYDHCPFRGI